tara:strand:- start:97 stop:735 length:639 start_codon:yes stop_codon:yes gene_type:complete
MTKKIIAFSLWGSDLKYTIGAIRNAELAKNIFPDWECHFYCGNDVPIDILNQLDSLGSTIIEMDGTSWNGMFWRFFPADSDDTMISRDTDSRLSVREHAAVQEWLSSDKDFHIIRDHPYHATEILGGMWGVRNGLLKGIKASIDNYDKGEFDDKWQVDQNFLRDVIFPTVQDKSFVHDEFFEKKPFPNNAPSRTNTDFIGQVYNQFDEPEFT